MRTLGTRVPFRERPWQEIQTRFRSVATDHPDFQPMADIVDSVIVGGATEELAGCTSMFDLWVVAKPQMDLPYDMVRVMLGSGGPVDAGTPDGPVPPGDILIEHLATTGRNDRIRRPVDEATRLFWRFMIEKFGVRPSFPS